MCLVLQINDLALISLLHRVNLLLLLSRLHQLLNVVGDHVHLRVESARPLGLVSEPLLFDLHVQELLELTALISV